MLARTARAVNGCVVVFCLGASTPVWSFGFADVTEKAQALAQTPYKAPSAVPEFLTALPYDRYQSIRFKPEANLWRQPASAGKKHFEVMMVPAGSVYRHAVTLNEVDQEGVRPLIFNRDNFTYPSPDLAKRIPADLGYAGFGLTWPLQASSAIKNPERQGNQFLVFAGASYFRGVGADNGFGLSARGLAIDTGLPSGEEFPAFTEFWLERPAANSGTMTVYALLDSPSATGAYRFVITPGAATGIEVSARLFARSNIDQIGLAPLTSMFYFGENTRQPAGEWRPQVHDSDGLLIQDEKSAELTEWVWRPLLNPTSLRMNYFQVTNLKGFGLMQRDIRFDDFSDAEAHYEKRPSAWIDNTDEWGSGEVVLVEIPTSSEANDNIVAFWKPRQKIEQGAELSFQYRLRFGEHTAFDSGIGRVVDTWVGAGRTNGTSQDDNNRKLEGTWRVVVDFVGDTLSAAKGPVVSEVGTGENADVLEHFVEHLPEQGIWRLSMLVKPASNNDTPLRARLLAGPNAVSETWLYQLPDLAQARQ